MRPAAVELVLSLTLLLPVAAARAEAPTSAEARCVRAMSGALVKLAGDLADRSMDCLDDHADDDLEGSLEHCLLANPANALKDADTDPARRFARRCTDGAPFGLTDPESVSFAAVHGVRRALRHAFGADFDGALAKDDDGTDLSKCQLSVAEEMLECHEVRLKAFNRCQKKGLRNGFESAEDLEACIGADPSGRIARKCDLAAELADCQDYNVSLATALPGVGEPGAAATHLSLTQSADCQSCLALNTASGLSANCDLQDDGIVNGSCTALACDANPLTFTNQSGDEIELADGGVLQLDCPIVPNPTPTQNASPSYGMDHFAWNTFIAMNWPAVSGSDVRGIPDLTSNFANAQPSDLLVWETLKEKREVFYRGSCTTDNNIACSHDSDCQPADGTCNLSVPPGQTGRSAASLMWNGPLQYGPQGDELSAVLCPDAPPGTMPSRVVTSSTKLHFDSLDETLEVQSEALESFTELCAGYNVVDPETTCTEADPPACCTIQGQPVGPRVWKGDPTQGGTPVLYEVKVNYDYFDYVTDASHMYYLDSKAQPAAASAAFLLPYRTNAFTGGSPANTAAIRGYDAQKCFLAHGYDGTGEFPCAIGAVHLKAAWILLDGEDPSEYHTADASYFKANPDDPNEICQTSGTFGLVGLHIIQRTHQVNPPTTPPTPPGFNAIGGAYIFATWEHVGNDTAGFRYANYHFSTSASPASGGFYPATTDTLALTRMFDLLDATKTVNQNVHDSLGCPDSASVWCNYRLIGTQFKPVEADDLTITNGEQPYYLANLLLESNLGLQMFQGLPPKTTPIPMFSSVPANAAASFNPDTPNTQFGRSPKNMGGCLGCHGVAQLNGYTFSFVSQDGQRGAGIDTETPGQFGPAPTGP